MQMSRDESNTLVLFSAPPHSEICLALSRRGDRRCKVRKMSRCLVSQSVVFPKVRSESCSDKIPDCITYIKSFMYLTIDLFIISELLCVC